MFLQPLLTQQASPRHKQDVEVSRRMQLVFTVEHERSSKASASVGRRARLRSGSYTPEDVVDDDVHQLQPGAHEEDDILDVSGGDPATFQGEHFFHFMFLSTTKNGQKT